MKRLLIAAILPVLFFACNKEEEDLNPPLRTPTCADTTDDGVFEKFSKSEEAQFLSAYKYVPDTEFKQVIRYKYLNSHILFNNGIDYSPYLVYRVNRPVKVFVYLPFYSQQEQYYSWVQTAVDSSRNDTINLYNARELALQAGCYRLYYVVADNNSDTVYTKGHYDIEIKK